MIINEVEKHLGITKANIRFYEKEGLITPNRTSNGYRDYSDTDVQLLKKMIILRKLGFPVQQIQDILDGATPLQEALDANILSLQTQAAQISGSLALCRQLQQEDADSLDTNRYWNLIANQEQKGVQFQTLVDDYLKFTEFYYEWLFFPLRIQWLHKPWYLGIFICTLSALSGFMTQLSGGSFLLGFSRRALQLFNTFLLWTALFLPLYLLSKKKPKLANTLLVIIPVAMLIMAVLAAIWIIASRVVQ